MATGETEPEGGRRNQRATGGHRKNGYISHRQQRRIEIIHACSHTLLRKGNKENTKSMGSRAINTQDWKNNKTEQTFLSS